MGLARHGLLSLALSTLAFGICQAQDVESQLKALPHVTAVRKMERGTPVTYDLSFEQPVDHKNPTGPKFTQHVFVRHAGYDKPVILGTEGYSANGAYGGELRGMLESPNEITVEHRYFGRSIPEPCVWKHLTIKNAADDMHEIVQAMKSLYKGKWVATGASKGGQTALFFKCYYPNDVDATVAYVAPINIGQEDPRINQFMATVGDEATRNKIKAFQIALLKNEDEVLAILKPKASDYSMGVGKAYEYGVLEFPYAFWQYGSNVRADSIPAANASASDLAKAYMAVNAMYYYSDAGIKQFEAFQYQAFTEIGYYNYDITDFKPYLKSNPNPTNMDLCPAGTQKDIVYNPDTLAFVFRYLQYEAKNVAYIYGETDAWSATAMQLLGRTNSVKIVVKGAWHNAGVRLATKEQQTEFFDAMDGWLGMKLKRH